MSTEIEVLNSISSKLDILLERTEGLSAVKSDKPLSNLKTQSNNDLRQPNLEKLAKKLQVPEEELMSIIDLGENDFQLIRKITGKNDSEKMLKATIIISTLNYFIFEIEIINTRILTDKVESLGINHNNHLYRVLKGHIEFFVPKNKSEYKITVPCQMRGLELVKELLNTPSKEV